MKLTDQITRQSWREWAALAWSEFLSSGRGAVFIDLSFVSDSRMQADAEYVIQTGLVNACLFRPIDGQTFTALCRAIFTYDPEREVIFLVREDDTCRCLTLALDPSPPMVFINRIGSRPKDVMRATLMN